MAKEPKRTYEIDWYSCRADKNDVKYNPKLKIGDVMWRAVRGFGDVCIDHDHHAGWHLDCTEDEAKVIYQALEIYRKTGKKPNELTKK